MAKGIDGAEAARIMYGGEGGMSESLTVRDILHQIQKKIIVPKSRFNKFGNYHYRNAEDIVDVVKNLLPEGASLKITDDIIMLGTRYYIKATAILIYKNGTEEASGYAREAEAQKGMAEGQVTGSTSSYARKYALNGLFAIDDGVDSDSQDNTSGSSKKIPEPLKTTPEQKLAEAKKQAAIIIAEYKLCKNLPMLADVQEKYHKQLKAFCERYEDIFSEINTAGLQVIGSFDN